MPHQITNKAISKKIAYFIADLEYNEVSDPLVLAEALEYFLNDIMPENSTSSPNLTKTKNS